MTTTKKTARKPDAKNAGNNDGVMLGVHLDIGHSSIGWAVTKNMTPLMFLGCGTVLFPKDRCLASERRTNRRQRRHIRSTRQRIARMKTLLAHLGVLSERELNNPGSACPWKMAAEVLAKKRTLSWNELWDVLRWYAHNRGYDGNQLWQKSSENREDDKKTRQSLQNAQDLMNSHKTTSMAETICAVMGIVPGTKKSASTIRYKAAKASFPREIVSGELRRILIAHCGKLPKVREDLIRALLGSPITDKDAWSAIPCPAIKLPKRYVGGLLFGQLQPRFDNRIIGECPVSAQKLPLKNCPEFLEYRWAMFLANIRVQRAPGSEPAPLYPDERKQITEKLRTLGHFSLSSLKKTVNEIAGASETNLDDMLLHPDAEKALVLSPVLQELLSSDLKRFWNILPEQIQKRIQGKLKRGKRILLRDIREWTPDRTAFDQILHQMSSKRKKSSGDPLNTIFKAEFPAGRAPYARPVLRQAVAEVMEGRDPRAEGGVLYSASAPKVLPENQIDLETNNHLVRHRLRIMRRLLDDIVREFAHGDKSLIANVTVEFNRDVQSMSGKTAQTIAQELGLRLKTHKSAVDYAAKELGAAPHTLGGAFIRKVRIAQDLDWTCPYTKQLYDIHQLQDGSVDLDHIIPRSKRNSDSLDSLVVTFKAINAWKSNATAFEFVQANQGKTVPGMPNLSIVTLNQYLDHIALLKKMKMPHPDDQRRRDNRCRRLLVHRADESAAKGFTPRDLTVSSHVVRLAAAVIRDFFQDQDSTPSIHPIPGRITKEVRMALELIGLLAAINPLVLNEDGSLKTKTEIRSVTHLHHAVDAVTLGLASALIPVDGAIWEAMIKRNLAPNDKNRLQKTGAFLFDAKGRPVLKDLDSETRQSIAKCLAECRVATHIPAKKHGAAIDKTTWRVTHQKGRFFYITQRNRDGKNPASHRKTDKNNASHLLGLAPKGTSKLNAIKGVMVVNENFGVALDPVPEVIPFHCVWNRIRGIKRQNNGVMPRILRKGMLIRVKKGRYEGLWKVFSIKDAAKKNLIDIGDPDAVALQNGIPGHRINVSKDGLEICPAPYTGIPRNVPPHH